MRRALKILAVATLFGIPTGAFDAPVASAQQQQSRDDLLRTLIATHPTPDIRTLDTWLRTGTVSLIYEPRVREMVVQLLNAGPALLVNEHFLRTADIRYQYLALTHAYRRLQEHFFGNFPLLAQRPTTAPEATEHARIIWNSELIATRAQWQLAKQLGVPHFLPILVRNAQTYGDTERALIHSVYEMRRQDVPAELQAEFSRQYTQSLAGVR